MAEIKVPASDLSRKTSSTSRKKSTVARKSGTPRQLGPSSRDKEARMQAMIDAAVALFSEEGYSAVSTLSNCRTCGLFRDPFVSLLRRQAWIVDGDLQQSSG